MKLFLKAYLLRYSALALQSLIFNSDNTNCVDGCWFN